MKEIAFLGPIMSYMNQNPGIIHPGNTIQDLASPEYSLYDKVNWLRGNIWTFEVVYPHLWDVDFREDAT